ncbi:MAG: Mur ligase family protein, partial [Spirochaetaceae bacterium]|nr:Mur ligase family protein [Spirochaetaceae bacterium]
MSLAAAACAAALAYFAFLAAERAVLSRARGCVGTVVHVNGTRGKSETTRLLAAALRASGRPTLAKTTGTESRLIFADGSERRLRRFGAADVREQRNLLIRAARSGASCLVAECMAVSAEAQAASDAFLSPDMLLVTNARPDHEAELGDAQATAAVFALLIPRGGTVLTADGRLFPLLEREAAARGAKAYLSSPIEEPGLNAISDNAGLALLAAELLGLDRAKALEGMKSFRPDPGAFAFRFLGATGGGAVLVADALAANDPESASRLLERVPRPVKGGPLLFIAA